MKRVPYLFITIFGALGISLAVAPLASADPNYYPTGPQTDVAISTVSSGGWTRCYTDFYGSRLPTFETLQSQCEGDYVLYAGGATGGSTFLLLAAGERDVVFNATNYVISQETVSASSQLSNGSYWYGQDDLSIGFSPEATVRLNQADVCKSSLGACTTSDDGSLRLSWHGNGLNDGGWRIGLTDNLNVSNAYIREIWVSDGSSNSMPLISKGSTTLTNSGSSFTCSPSSYSVGQSEVKVDSYIYRLYVNGALNSTIAYDGGSNIALSMVKGETNKLPAALKADSATWDLSSLEDYSVRCEVTAVGYNSSVSSASETQFDAAYLARISAAAQAWEDQRAAATAANYTKEKREMRKRIAARATNG